MLIGDRILDLSCLLLMTMIVQSSQMVFSATWIATEILAQVQCLAMISKACLLDINNSNNCSSSSINNNSNLIHSISSVINNKDLTVLIIMPRVKSLKVCFQKNKEIAKFLQHT